MAVGTVICLAVPGPLMGLFTENPETIRQEKQRFGLSAPALSFLQFP